ncbi:MAG: hypothetical protein JNK78_07445 [Planctomycetes bacterium]|nr:hypothetical protein [Planctomycetota bacterium]
MATGDHLGPALTHVEPDDADALRALFAEQRARLDVVREHRLFEWVGGASPGRVALTGLTLQLACVGLVAVGLIVAGITRGPWLWGIFAVAAACLAVRAALVGPPTQKALHFCERAVLVPGVVVADVPFADPSLSHLRCAAVMVAPGGVGPAAFAAFVAAADRLRSLLAEDAVVVEHLQAFVGSVRRGLAARVDDGHRIAVPVAIGDGFELAHLAVPIPLLPRGEFSSRLVFVLLDPAERDAGQARIVQSTLWGNGVEQLCERFPREEAE